MFFSAEAILASSVSKFGCGRPKIDRDVYRSSTAFPISTSFIRGIASAGWLDQERTPVLKFVFQSRNVDGACNFSNGNSENLALSAVPP